MERSMPRKCDGVFGHTAIIFVTLLITWSTATSPDSTKPNIVIFLVDDLGIGDIGCFGNDTIRTPNIDRIAREGAILTHHLAAASLCTPSRAAFLTGRYPIRSGMVASHFARIIIYVSSTSGLPANETTFAEVAQRQGYSTALIGKWHLGVHCQHADDFCHHPVRQGFDYFYGLPLSNAKDFGNDGGQTLDLANPKANPLLKSIALGGLVLSAMLYRRGSLSLPLCCVLAAVLVVPTGSIYFVLNNIRLLNSLLMKNLEYIEQPVRFENFTRRLVSEAVGFLEKNQQEDNGKPFLLMMSMVQVHTVLHASADFRGHSKHGAYGDEVEEMDWSIGEVMTSLERLGVLNNTLVYFTSDNGGHLEEVNAEGEHEGGYNGIYRGGKGQGGMEGGIRVPAAVRWPGHVTPGTVISTPTSLMDVFPTLSEGIWGEAPPTDRVIDGRNIYPLLTGADRTPVHRFLFHYCGDQLHAATYTPGNGDDVFKVHFATPNWLPGIQGCSYVCHCHGKEVTWHDPPLLYNIARDPSEEHLLDSTDHAHRQILADVAEAVRNHKSTLQPVPNQFSIAKLAPRPWLQPCLNFPSCDDFDPNYSYLRTG